MKQTINVTVEKETLLRLKEQAKTENRTPSNLIDTIINKYLNEMKYRL